MIDLKKAIEIALTHIKEIYPNVSNFEVEEVEISDDDSHWAITLSMPDERVKGALALSLTGYPKKYKSLNIDAKTGRVKAMKIRNI